MVCVAFYKAGIAFFNEEEVCIAVYCCQDIVEVMRNAAGKLSYSLHLLGMPQLFFKRPFFGDVFHNAVNIGIAVLILFCHSV